MKCVQNSDEPEQKYFMWDKALVHGACWRFLFLYMNKWLQMSLSVELLQWSVHRKKPANQNVAFCFHQFYRKKFHSNQILLDSLQRRKKINSIFDKLAQTACIWIRLTLNECFSVNMNSCCPCEGWVTVWVGCYGTSRRHNIPCFLHTNGSLLAAQPPWAIAHPLWLAFTQSRCLRLSGSPGLQFWYDTASVKLFPSVHLKTPSLWWLAGPSSSFRPIQNDVLFSASWTTNSSSCGDWMLTRDDR